MSKSRKWKIMASTFTLTGVILSTGIGYGSYLLFKDDSNEQNNIPVIPMQDHKKSQYGFDVQYYTDNKNSSVLDSTHISDLYNKIDNIGIYGPEAKIIKRVSIDDPRIANGYENGAYSPSTFEIGLNTQNFEKEVVDENSYIPEGFPNIYSKTESNDEIKSKYASFAQDIIVEELLETYYHEYGHHLFSSYASNPLPSQNNYTKDISEYSNVKRQNRVNSAFLNKFEEIFSYDDDKKYIVKDEVNQISSQSGEKFDPIGSRYSLKELYEGANKNATLNYNSGDNKVYFGLKDNTSKQHVGPNNHFTYAEDISHLKYFYSVEELFTRKFLLSTLPVSDTAINMSNGLAMLGKNIKNYNKNQASVWKGYIQNTENTKLLTAFTRGMLKYSDPFLAQNSSGEYLFLKPNYDYAANNFYNDDPFYNGTNKNAGDFARLVAESTGLKQGYSLSYIAHANNYKYSYRRGYLSTEDTSTYDMDNLIVGGYMPKSKVYSKLGYVDSKGNIIKVANIINYSVDISFKKGLLYDDKNTTPTYDDVISWVTSEPINAYNIKDKPLGFYNDADDNDFKLLESYRGETKLDKPSDTELVAGRASSWSENDPYDNSESKTWVVDKNSSGKIIITKGGVENYENQ